LQHALHDRMAALLDLEDVGIIDGRLGPVGFAGEFRPAAENIHLGDGLRGGQQRFGPGDDLGQQGLEQFGLAGERLLVGAQDLALLGAQLLGRETFGVHHRLLADVIGGHRGEIRLGDLDRIAEGAVITDLQRFDAGAVLLVAFEFGDPTFAVGSKRTKAVQFRVETGAQRTAFAEVHGKFVAQGRLEPGEQRRLGVDARGLVGERAAGEREQFFADRRQGAKRVADPAEFARVTQAVLQTGQDARDVPDAAERFADARRGPGVLAELTDGILSTRDRGEIRRRLGQPEGQQPGARRRLGAVDGLEQRAFASAVRGSEELEVARGSRIQQHGRTQFRLDESEKVLGSIAQRVGDVAQHGAGGAERRMLIRQPEAGETVHR